MSGLYRCASPLSPKTESLEPKTRWRSADHLPKTLFVWEDEAMRRCAEQRWWALKAEVSTCGDKGGGSDKRKLRLTVMTAKRKKVQTSKESKVSKKSREILVNSSETAKTPNPGTTYKQRSTNELHIDRSVS